MTDIVQRDHAHLFVATREGVGGIQLDRGEAQVLPWGLYGSFVRCLLVDAKGTLLAAGVRQEGVRVTADGGGTWKAAAGLDSGDIRAIAAAGSVVYAGTADARLHRSSDGGRSFREVATFGHPGRESWTPFDAPTARISALIAQRNRLVVGVASGGVFLSQDDGNSFTARNEGLPATVLTLTSLPGEGGGVLAGTADGLWRTDDVATAPWRLLFRPRQRSAVTAVAIDPTDPNVLLCSASRALNPARPAEPEGADAAIFRSEDGGRSFAAVPMKLPVLRGTGTAMVVHGRDVYLGTTAGEILDSRDGGRTFALCAATLPGVLDLARGNSAGRI